MPRTKQTITMDLGRLFSKVVKTVANSIEAEQRKTTATPQPKPAPQPTATPHYEDEEIVRTDAEWVAYFREILQMLLGECLENKGRFIPKLVEYLETYKAEWGQPYTFLLEQGGTPKGVVMLGKGNSHDSKVKYLIARMYAKKSDIPYINFYTQMPNKRDYVIGRIRKFLN